MVAVTQLEERLAKLQIEIPRGEEQSVSVLDFGARPEQNFCNLAAFTAALQHCTVNRCSRLIIPHGVYHFYTAPSPLGHLVLNGMEDFTFDGQGSELIFEHTSPYLTISNCCRILLKNLILDWAWEKYPLADVGVIRRVAENGESFELTFPARKQVPTDLKIHIVGPFDPQRYTPGCPDGIEFRPYRNLHVTLAGDGVDDGMQALVRELDNILLPSMERVDSNTLRIFLQDAAWGRAHLRAGQCYNLRHYEYDTVAVSMFDSHQLTFRGVTIYGCPGSGFVGNGELHHLHLDRCVIRPRPGTSRSVSTTVDCLHICNSQGHFLIEDCDFGYAGDDCINIHDNCSMGVRRLDDHRLLALRVKRSAVLFEAGYSVELRNGDLSPLPYCSVLTDVCYHEEDNSCTLTFRDALPERLAEDTVLWNGRFATDNYIIRNCRFTNNRARGMLLQGSYGIVENNVFENIQGAAVQIETGCESRWSEGKGVHDLIFRNNIIRHCDLNAWQMAVVYMGVYLPGGRTDYPVFHDILFANNTIADCPRLGFFLSSCTEVEVRNNVMINSNQVPLEAPCYGSSTMEEPIYGEQYHGAIQFAHCRECVETGNEILCTQLQASAQAR